ncbi:hypothetical protein IWQ56_003969, partial [Coemansia nantahalensis]
GGYWNGRFTNSYVWNEYTANILGLTLVNKAYGAATTNNQFTPGTFMNVTVPSFHDQAAAWLAANPAPSHFHLNNDIIEIEIGGNDILHHAVDLMTGKLNPVTFAAQVASNIASDVGALAAAGYKNINLWNLPAAEMSPYIRSVGASAMVKQLVDVMNAAIAQAVGAVAATHKGVRVIDLSAFIHTALHPNVLSAMAITNTVDACYVKDAAGTVSICANPDEHFFYDDTHPASRMHYLWGVVAAGLTRDPTAQLTADFIANVVTKFGIGQSNVNNNIIAGSLPAPPKCH